MGARAGEVRDVAWAERIIAAYERGERLPKVSLAAAMEVLGLKPGTVIRLVKPRRFDRMAAVAGNDD